MISLKSKLLPKIDLTKDSKIAISVGLILILTFIAGWLLNSNKLKRASNVVAEKWELPLWSVPDTSQDRITLTTRHPWGAKKSDPERAAVFNEEPVKLMGIVKTGGKYAALIRSGTKKPISYEIGALLPDGSKLISVGLNKVVLEKNGGEVELWLFSLKGQVRNAQ
jgi:hypothetical protein